jgi:YD repeat-containing protein
VALDYDAANRRTLLTLPNGISTEYVYDLGSRLSALVYRNGLTTLGDLQYTYDAAGNRIAIGGSWARSGVPDAIPSTSYDAANQQLAFADVTQTFDSNGNLLTRTDGSGTTTYTWDARNRLTGITGPNLAASFSYDALGRRAVKTINGQDTTFQYDGLDILQESGATGAVSYLRTLSIDEALARTDTTSIKGDVGSKTTCALGRY